MALLPDTTASVYGRAQSERNLLESMRHVHGLAICSDDLEAYRRGQLGPINLQLSKISVGRLPEL